MMHASGLGGSIDDLNHDLDSVLLGLRRFWQRPEVRARLREQLDPDVELRHYRALRAIQIAGVLPSIKEVAAVLEVEASTASRLVEQVVAAGYVQRETDATDRRRCGLRLTEPGQRTLNHLTDTRVALLEELTDGWTQPDLESFVTVGERLLAACEQLLIEDVDATADATVSP